MTDNTMEPKSDRLPVGSQCWCGSVESMVTGHPQYVMCKDCNTARWVGDPIRTSVRVDSDESHLYGREYWFKHQEGMGLPDIYARSRADLAGRCQYWLSYVMRYRPPFARALEIGCSHGGFVRLLNDAGYDSTGIEMSPTIVRYARDTFGVNVVQGPLEDLELPQSSFDVVMMFDVLEHLGNPAREVEHISTVLKEDGLLVIQTPEYQCSRPASWVQFKPPEHVFLYSSVGVERLLSEVGLKHIAYEPAIFEDDMFLFAARYPLIKKDPTEVDGALLKSPGTRTVLAMQDMYRDIRVAQSNLRRLPEIIGVVGCARLLVRAGAAWARKRVGLRRPPG